MKKKSKNQNLRKLASSFFYFVFSLSKHTLSQVDQPLNRNDKYPNQIANPFKYVYFCNIISATMTLPAVAAIEGVVSPVVVYDLDARLSLTIRSLISNNSILKEMKRLVSKEKQPQKISHRKVSIQRSSYVAIIVWHYSYFQPLDQQLHSYINQI